MTDRAALRPDPWAQVWRTLASGRLLLVWLVILALVGLIALWFPQAPRGAYLQEDGLEGWLTTVRPQLGRSADTLLALGLLSVAQAVWLRLILLGTTLTLLLRAYDAIQWLTSAGLSPRQAFSLQLRTTLEPPATLETVRAQLPQGFRVRIEDDPDYRLTAHRPLAHFGPLGTMLGGLFIIGGWLYVQTAGWEVSDLRMTEDEPGVIPPSNQTLLLDALEVHWGAGDGPTAASARLILGDGPVEATGEITLNSSWRWQGVTYSLIDVGPALQVSGARPNGEALMLQTAAHRPPTPDLTFMLHSDGEPRSFAAPEEGVVVQVEAGSPSDRLSVHLRIYQGQAGELVEDRSINAGRSIALGDSQLNFLVIPFVQVKASYAPGRFLVVLGAAIVVAGLLASLVFRPLCTEAIALVNKDETELTLAVSRPTDSSWLETLAGRLELSQTGENNGD